MFAHDHAVTDNAEYNDDEYTFHTYFEADGQFMEESDPFSSASVRPGRADIGSKLTNDLRFSYHPPTVSNSAYNTLNALSQSERMVAEFPSMIGAMSSDEPYLLGLGGAFACSPWTEDHSLEGMDIDHQSNSLWPSEPMDLANLEGVAPQSPFGATTRYQVFADSIDGFDSMDRARAPIIFDNGLELPPIPEEYHWGCDTDSHFIFNIFEQRTQDGIGQDDSGTSIEVKSTVNQDQLSAHSAGPFEQVVGGPKTCDSILERVKDAEPASANARATKPFICREIGCKSEGFTHSFDLQRHKRTVHMEQGAGYRCTVQECPKADKLWTRHDGYKKHVMKRHSDANFNDLVKLFNRSRPNADARFSFSITTPTMISRKEQAAKSTKLQSARVEDWERLSQI